MRTRNIIAIFFLAAFILMAIFYALVPTQPKYHGRSLNSWLNALDDGDHDTGLVWQTWPDLTKSQPGRAEAAEAIRHIGTNSFPYLLTDLTNHDSAIKQWLASFISKQRWIKLALPVPASYQRPASLALHILGPAAKPAIPRLTQILQDPQNCKGAAVALAGIGPEGWAVLTRAITTNDTWSSACAIWALGSHRATVPGTLAALLGTLTNSTSGGGAALSAWALGEIGQDSEHVVPVLINALQSSNNDARWSSAAALGKFTTNAQTAVPALLNAIHDTDSQVRNNATTSLKEIDPEAAAKAAAK